MPAYKLRMRVFGGLDGLLRVINILRRGKVKYREMIAAFNEREVSVEIIVDGDSFEVWWVASKIERLPETLCIRVIPPEDGENRGRSVATVAERA